METIPDDKVGACWECGYLLRGLTTPRCPECGRPFNPADPTTMNMGVEVKPLQRWLMRPPGWPLHLLTAAAIFFSLWACVFPVPSGYFIDTVTDTYAWRNTQGRWFLDYLPTATMFRLSNPMERFLLGAVTWMIVGLLWVTRRVARGITVKRLSRQKAATFAYWRRWLITPVIFGLTVLLCRSSLPTYLGFWCSKPWLDRAVLDVKSSAPFLPPRRMGLFDPYPPTGFSPQILRRFDQTMINVSERNYFIYRDDGKPDSSWDPSRYSRLSSYWFWVTSVEER